MPSVCCYLQVHQPLQLRRFSYLDTINNADYFDTLQSQQILKKIAAKSYIPTTKLLLEMIEKHQGRFRLALSFSGIVIEQLREYAPEALTLFQELVKTGCVEVLAETYYHSLAVLFNEEEYVQQLKQHAALIQETFNVTPRVLRNSELLYSDRIGQLVSKLGYRGILTGIGHYQLGWRSPNYLYQCRGNDLVLFIKNYQLSDDIAFRFSRHDWQEFPLTADKFASWIHKINGAGDIVNLFMDFETFGEHHWDTSGIFHFLEFLPQHILSDDAWQFVTPSEAITKHKAVGELLCAPVTSWGSVGTDLAAWLGGSLQGNALSTLYGMEPLIRNCGNDELLEAWRRLQSSDNFYYMLPSGFNVDDNKLFNPYGNQSDAYINYMNVLRDLEKKAQSAGAITKITAETQETTPSLDTLLQRILLLNPLDRIHEQ